MKEGLLKGKKGIIFGALNDKSIAWQVALKAFENGAELVLTNSPVAMRLGTIGELAKITGSKVIAADATKMEDIEALLSESMTIFGGKFDFILHSIGMSPNVRKDIPYEQTSYENMLKTFDISALSFHRVLQTAYKLDAINEWGSVVAHYHMLQLRGHYRGITIWEMPRPCWNLLPAVLAISTDATGR